MPQTHQERVCAVLAGERPDRPVLDLGGLDVQRLLLFGTPNEVRAHVRRYFEALGAERYIMAPANSLQPGTPPENIVAPYQTAKEL
jgi:uroporphyrinogen-III decarboxylase